MRGQLRSGHDEHHDFFSDGSVTMIPGSLSIPGIHSSDEIVVVPHDAAWPARFRIESQLLHVALSELQPSIEHIGSTAVSGLAAKPIIDMLVGVESLAAFETQARRLAVFGYQYIPEYERALPDRRFFKRVVNGVRTHHVHVVEKNGVYWKRYMKFRNSLRDDAWLAARYAEVKRRLAARFSFDRDAYTNGKTGFIEAVLAMPPRGGKSVPMGRPPFAFTSQQPAHLAP
jgi:GrpB-like predicted nucleotidyltransferase (UPF0157 family)